MGDADAPGRNLAPGDELGQDKALGVGEPDLLDQRHAAERFHGHGGPRDIAARHGRRGEVGGHLGEG